MDCDFGATLAISGNSVVPAPWFGKRLCSGVTRHSGGIEGSAAAGLCSVASAQHLSTDALWRLKAWHGLPPQALEVLVVNMGSFPTSKKGNPRT